MEKNPNIIVPPLEYCRVERAAKILGLEVEDIIHLGAIGSINVHLKLDGVDGCIYLNKDQLKNIDDISNKKVTADFWRGKLGVHSKFITSKLLSCPSSKKNSDSYFYSGIASGFWRLPLMALNEIEDFGVLKIGKIVNGSSQRYLDVYPANADNETIQKFTIKDDHDIEINSSKLWVMRLDVIKVQSAINNKKTLNSIFNDASIQSAAISQEDSLSSEIGSIVRKCDMIKALILVNPILSSKIEKPGSVLTALKKLSATAGFECPVKDSSTLRDWLAESHINQSKNSK